MLTNFTEHSHAQAKALLTWLTAGCKTCVNVYHLYSRPIRTVERILHALVQTCQSKHARVFSGAVAQFTVVCRQYNNRPSAAPSELIEARISPGYCPSE